MSGFAFENLLREVTSLRMQLSDMALTEPSIPAGTAKTCVLNFYFEEVEGERKPFLLRADGCFVLRQNLSPIRVAILLILLLDLKDRTEGGRGCTDQLSEMKKAYCQLSSQADDSSSHLLAILRTGLHRFRSFIEHAKEFTSQNYSIIFNRDLVRLELIDRRTGKDVQEASISVQTTSLKVGSLIESSFAHSPLTRVKRFKTCYLESGEAGHDRFFRELFDHEHFVESWGTFERFSLQSQPQELLARAKISESRRAQARVMHEGFANGRCKFTEVHNMSTLWDCIRISEETGFQLYPSNFEARDVSDHLRHVIDLLRTYSNYEVFIVEAQIPFHVVTAQIFRDRTPDCYTAFIPRFTKEDLFSVNSFVVYDINLCRNVVHYVIGALSNLSSTVKDRAAVIERIEQVIRHLESRGPLVSSRR